MTKTTDDIADIHFIVAEIHRLNSMSLEERRTFFKGRPYDWLYSFPNPAGSRYLPCGREAHMRVEKLALRHLVTEQYVRDKVDKKVFVEIVKAQISDTFLRVNNAVDEKHVKKMLSRAVKKVAVNLDDLTSYIPCVLVSAENPDHFRVGPVRFFTMKRFLRDNEATIKEQKVGGKELLAYYSHYRWISEVTISGCDVATSKLRASTVLEETLNVLRLFMGQHASTIRQGHMPSSPLESAWLSRAKNDDFRITASWKTDDVIANDNWFERLTEKSGISWILAERILARTVVPAAADDATTRIADASTWYSQAIQELQPAPAIVKCVAALERLTMTTRNKKVDVTKTITTRVALLGSEGNDTRYMQVLTLARKIYDIRSGLMHGSISPSHEKARALRTECLELTRFTILVAMEFFESIRVEKGRVSMNDLDSGYMQLLKRLH